MKIDEMRLVLQWDKDPSDLDLHLRSEDFHISYRNMKSAPSEAVLDRDSMSGFGSETITLKKIEDRQKYQVFVHHFFGKASIDAKAQLHVYKNNELKKVLSFPTTNNGRCHSGPSGSHCLTNQP